MQRISRPAAALALTVAVGLSGSPALAADTLTRTPNIYSLQLANPGTVEFMFNHRIPGLATISAYPTLFFDMGVLPWLSLYSTYGSKGYAAGPLGSSPVQGSHDLGIALRQAILTQGDGGLLADFPVSLVLHEGASTIGIKSDAKALGSLSSNSVQQALGLTLGRTFFDDHLGILGTVRSVAYQYAMVDNKYITTNGIRTSGTLGLTLNVFDKFTLAGDWGKYVDDLNGIPAWSAAIQGKIPGSRHLIALEVSNVPTNTLSGTSQAAATVNDLFVGFTFSANMAVMKWLGIKAAPKAAAPEPQQAAEEPAMKMSAPAPAPQAPAATASVPAAAATPVPAAAATPAPAAPAVDTAALAAKGKKLFDSDAAGQGCASCHEAKEFAGFTAARVRNSFKSDSMADFRGMSDADLQALEAYLKTVKK